MTLVALATTTAYADSLAITLARIRKDAPVAP